MVARGPSPAFRQYVDDELLRAPMLFDQLIDATIDRLRKALPVMPPLQRASLGEVIQVLNPQRPRLAEYFSRSLQEQVNAELLRHGPKAAQAKPAGKLELALVDEDVVALDVELSHAIEAINSTAEYELRELNTFISALVGDMDVAADHNPFRAETYARAVWAAAQALPLSRGHQVAFMRHAGEPLAQILRRVYAASTSRLESMGVEPAAYRTLILPAGSRRGARHEESGYSPDLHRIRETMPAPLDAVAPGRGSLRYDGQVGGASRPEHWSDVARGTSNRVDRQAIELVSRLFEAMQQDERVPADVNLLIARLHGPAMRLTLRDAAVLDHDKHPLWRFISRLVHESQMAPDPQDPERVLLLKAAQAIVEQVAAEPEQNSGIYRWALDKLESFLHKRLTRRLAAAASHIGALQKLEARLAEDQATPSTLHGMLDVPQLDTVPAELLDDHEPAEPSNAAAKAWLEALQPGHWVRLFLQGRWVQAQLMWPGERREVWLFGDGASDATWAIRRTALMTMFNEHLAKTLKQRSIVGTAAQRVHHQMTASAAA
jgi:hypothetical protein